MRASVTRLGLCALCLGVAAGLAAPAHAFFPIGGYDPFGTLRLAKWPLSAIDTNNDGTVVDGEGIELLIEGGPSGFTAAEILQVRDSLAVWDAVSTSYAQFRVGGITQDPLLSGLEPDFRNVIAMQVSTDDNVEDVLIDPADVLIPDLAFPVLGITITLFAVEDTILEIAGQGITIGSGTIIDSDIILDAASMRPNPTSGADALVSIQGVLVHELGHFLGLGHTPLNNLRPSGPSGSGGVVDPLRLLENPAIYMTGPDGQQHNIGVTPTMFPIVFDLQQGEEFIDGGGDLAPDDISAVTYLYPRSNLANFFDVQHEARTQRPVGQGLPSIPLLGSHIVAWGDTDNNPDTPYVPVFSTMAGLYEKAINPQLEGRFDIQNLWKQFEQPGTQGAVFTPAYVFTSSPLNFTGFERQSPPGITADSVDTIQGSGSFSTDTRSESDYIATFPSEVFHEIENIIDVSNKDAGTPMQWNYERNALVSLETGETLPTIRPIDLPMFGDPNDVCPLNLIEGAATGGTGTGGIGGTLQGVRGFRDNYLMRSPIGTAIIGLYYQSGPAISKYMLANAAVFRAARAAYRGFAWCLENPLMPALLIAAASACAALAARRRLRRVLPLVALAALLAMGGEAAANIAYVTDAQLAQGATDIVVGTVTAQTPRWARGGRIYTDVSVEIETTAKGTANQKSIVTVTVVGGQIGAIRCQASESPVFNVGEEVVLYLNARTNGYVVHGGTRGTARILTDPEGKKYVAPDFNTLSGKAGKALREKAEARKAAKSGDAATQAAAQVPLDEYVAYLRALVQESAKAASK